MTGSARRNFLFILIALSAGVAAGLLIHAAFRSSGKLEEIAADLTILPDLFLRMIKMVIAPLVFCTLTVGIARIGDRSALNRLAARTLGWFFLASVVSLTLGLVAVNLMKPGAGLNLTLSAVDSAAASGSAGANLHDFVVHLAPASIFAAMAGNEILPIAIFAVFFGMALSAAGEDGAPIFRGLNSGAAIMLRVTGYVMLVAPLAVFCSTAHVIAVNGPAIFESYAKFIGGFYGALIMLWVVFIGIGYGFLGSNVLSLLRFIREPMLIALATASSEAAYPRLLEALERSGVPDTVASFVLPLGYSFNLDGSMLYMTFAASFVAQAYGVQMDAAQQLMMALTLMVTSKGMAGIPRASLVVVAAVMPQFGLPQAGLLLIVAIDQLLDMGRTGTNVLGNAIAASVIADWEAKRRPGPP